MLVRFQRAAFDGPRVTPPLRRRARPFDSVTRYFRPPSVEPDSRLRTAMRAFDSFWGYFAWRRQVGRLRSHKSPIAWFDSCRHDMPDSSPEGDAALTRRRRRV